jgi:hypothetical protein
LSSEHFVDIPAIRDAPNKAARAEQIAAWRRGTPEQQQRIAQYDAALYRAEAESRFVRGSGRFPLTAVGDVNTYALFAELSRTLLAPDGRAGIIVPTGIATDDGAKAFFGDLIARRQIISLYDFENREKLFADVDSRYKFSLLTIGAAQAAPRFVFSPRARRTCATNGASSRSRPTTWRASTPTPALRRSSAPAATPT